MDEPVNVVRKEGLTDRQMKENAVANAIGWAFFSPRRENESDEVVVINDEETQLCKEAALRAINALEHLGVMI